MINTKDPAWVPIQMEKRCPYLFRILAKKCITNRCWWQSTSIFSRKSACGDIWAPKVEGCGYHPGIKKIVKTGGNKPENFAQFENHIL
jgi:hypothetical protein